MASLLNTSGPLKPVTDLGFGGVSPNKRLLPPPWQDASLPKGYLPGMLVPSLRINWKDINHFINHQFLWCKRVFRLELLKKMTHGIILQPGSTRNLSLPSVKVNMRHILATTSANDNKNSSYQNLIGSKIL